MTPRLFAALCDEKARQNGAGETAKPKPRRVSGDEALALLTGK